MCVCKGEAQTKSQGENTVLKGYGGKKYQGERGSGGRLQAVQNIWRNAGGKGGYETEAGSTRRFPANKVFE